ncbi:MAG: hypothetical protein HYS26_03900 [Candidatus Kaiserbacteria bacterium]|nr:MAG: hypothetical protein HYS26_03900 [Candidatus Kaiserbacteria bacterium]
MTRSRFIARATAAAGSALFLLLPLVSSAEVALKNPLNFSDIASFVAGAMKVLVMIAIPIITLFVVIAGFKFITAQGNPGELETAKRNFVYVILGALLIMGAWVLATLIAGTVRQLTG